MVLANRTFWEVRHQIPGASRCKSIINYWSRTRSPVNHRTAKPTAPCLIHGWATRHIGIAGSAGSGTLRRLRCRRVCVLMAGILPRSWCFRDAGLRLEACRVYFARNVCILTYLVLLRTFATVRLILLLLLPFFSDLKSALTSPR